jgi:hypothetical protein
MKIRNGFQMKLLHLLNELSTRHKWKELQAGLKHLNENCNRFYINSYWKVNK